MQSNAATKQQTEVPLCCPDLSFDKTIEYYQWFMKEHEATPAEVAQLGREDRFFLLTVILGRPDAAHPWIYDRCREVEKNPDGHLDLWSRAHYKSTIITFAGSIQEILKDPNITIGIFSHSRPIATAFLDQIRQELGRNEYLKSLYPDVLYEDTSHSPSWGLNNGIVVKRTSNAKERTVEAWGLVDGQPVSKHFDLVIIDDAVTQSSVTTAEQIKKTTDAWELAQNLCDLKNPRFWHTGTRYNLADTYQTILDRGALIPRIYPATHDGTPDGKPVYLSQAEWDKTKRDSSQYTVACQQLQNPIAGRQQEMQEEWLRTYEVRPYTLNVYILCDYAGSRKSTGSSKTAMAVIGVDAHMNKYLLDGACHKMGLADRWKMLKHLRNKWVRAPGVQVVKVGYERYGAQSDIEHFEQMMQIEKNHFPIEEVSYPRDGIIDKNNRIRRLIPDFANWRFFIPYQGNRTSLQRQAHNSGEGYLCSKAIKVINEESQVYNLVEWWISNEYIFFPHTIQKDFLDAASRIYDLDVVAPQTYSEEDLYPEMD